jgi:hypothetical protein
MTYALARGMGQSEMRAGPPVRVGTLARHDPIVAFASVWASELLRLATERSPTDRAGWLRGELNKTHLGLGDEFVTQYRVSRALPGKTDEQALFDGLRLVLANRTAAGAQKYGRSRGGLSGLGSSDDIRNVFCGIAGVGTIGTSVVLGATNNPTASAAVGQTATTAMQAAGCNADALREQARIAEANAQTAQAQAAMAAQAQAGGGSNVGLYVGIGAGVLALGAVALFALKK